MPKPKKKRGPRQEKLRARQQKTKVAEQEYQEETVEDDVQMEEQNVPLTASNADEVRPFYGMLNPQEQEYFTRADEMLEFNQFGSPEGIIHKINILNVNADIYCRPNTLSS